MQIDSAESSKVKKLDLDGVRQGPSKMPTSRDNEPAQPKGVVKSVGRVFEVLELFGKLRRDLTATEVAKTLNYPQPSARVLLQSMVKLGYISFSAKNRTYFPTIRIRLLGEWVKSALYGSAHVFDFMEELHRETGETTTLSTLNGLVIQLVHVLPGIHPISLVVHPGEALPVATTSLGWAALSRLSDAEVEDIAQRIVRRRKRKADGLDKSQLIKHVEDVRSNGYAVGYEQTMPGAGGISIPVPLSTPETIAVVAVGGPTERIRASEEHLSKLMLKLVKKHF